MKKRTKKRKHVFGSRCFPLLEKASLRYHSIDKMSIGGAKCPREC